ncbi:COG1361 S-layer family protein [Haloplanus halophilus]|uniref:COG1361 S-layer family protein n=1 Tax=Haloplanus halophilus TaxID=2949993 RepID=UPI00204084CD|nr:COG1361 S-layer family protein [Haloplanus sp. GDY1]
MRQITVVGIVALLLLAPVVPVTASSVVTGNPELSYSVGDDTFRANEEATLTVVASNDGDIDDGGIGRFEDQVQTARSVQMDIQEGQIDAPIDVKSGTVTTGSIGPGGTAQFSFNLEIGDAEPGTYTIPVEVTYRHARAIIFDETPSGPAEIEYTWLDEEQTVDLTIRIEERSEFDIVSEGTNQLFAGDTGSLAFTIKNTGSQTARNASVQLSSAASGVFFGNPTNPARDTGVFVRSLDPGETRRVSVQVGATDDVSPGEYPVNAVVSYRDENDIGQRSDTLTTGVMVRPERTFSMADLSTSNFRVDENEATISGEITNTGPAPARNVVVRLRDHGTVTPTNGESAVGTLDPGESADVSFTTAIASDAEPGSNSFTFDVEYENADGDVLTASNPIRKRAEIAPERDRFEVSNVSTTVTPGGTAQLSAEVRYIGDDPISAVNARLFTSDPLSTSDDGAFLGRMEPGETTTATFRISATSDALPKQYASSIEVRYDEADGDTEFTDGMSIGVSVNEPSGGQPVPPAAVGGVLVLIVIGLVVWYRRR